MSHAPRHSGDPVARATAWAALSAGGLTAVLLAAPLLAGLSYVGLDLTRLDLGVVSEMQRLLGSGASLVLSPSLGDGAPLLGRPGAQWFYPLRWLVLPLPPDLAVSTGVVLHLGLAAAGAAWLARAHRVRPLGAATAGLFYACSGVCLDLIVHSYYLVGATWLPLAWAAARRALGRRASPWAVLLAGLGIALALLGGEPQTALLGLGLLGVELLRARAWRPPQRPRAARLMLAALGGLAVGLLPWWSFLAEARLGGRAAGLALDQVLRWSFDPALWASALLPGELFAQPRPAYSLWLQLAGTGDGAWNQAPYVGALFVAVLLAAAACRCARAPGGVALAALGLALGAHLPVLGPLARLLPPLTLFRYPQKYLLLAVLAGTVTAWVGLAGWSRQRRPPRALRVALAAMALGLLGLAASTAFAGSALDRLARAIEDVERYPELAHLSATLAWSCLRAALPVLAALAMLWSPRLRRRGLGPLLALDVALAGSASLPVGAGLADLRSPLREVAAPGADHPRLCVAYFGHTLAEQQPGGAQREPWTQMALYRLFLVPDLHACDGVVSPLLYSPLQTHANENLQIMLDAHRLAAARALGCSHLVGAGPPVDEPAPRLVLRGAHALAESGPQVYAVPDALPDAFVARHPQLQPGLAALLDAVAASHSAAAALAVVDDPLRRLAPGTRLPTGDDAVQVRLTRRATNDLRLDIEGRGAALVGVRQSFWSGWRAQQAGRDLPVVRVAGQQLGVVVDEVAAGPIVLRYRAPRLWPGIGVALAGALGLAWSTHWPHRARREVA